MFCLEPHQSYQVPSYYEVMANEWFSMLYGKNNTRLIISKSDVILCICFFGTLLIKDVYVKFDFRVLKIYKLVTCESQHKGCMYCILVENLIY